LKKGRGGIFCLRIQARAHKIREVEQRAGTVFFRVSLRKRLKYAATGLLFLLAAVGFYFRDGDAVLFRLSAVVVPGILLIYYYLHRIRLKMDDEGISLFWPLQGEKRLKWDEIAQVRRSDAAPGRYFFIDLIASPDRSVQFNPFMFECPSEIVNELNRHLRFELLGGDAAKEKLLSDELAAVADEKPDALSGSQWLLIAALICVLIVGIFFLLK